MSYNMENNNGASRTVKTIILYSAIIVFFGVLLGSVYFFASRPVVVDEGEMQNIRDSWTQEQRDIYEVNLYEIDPDLVFESEEDIQAYIDSHIPPEYTDEEDAGGAAR